jgi:tetratricopeptide (TPR) repeat protein
LEAAAAHYAQAIRWDGRNWQPHLGLGMLDAARRSGCAIRIRPRNAWREALAASAQAHLRRAGELNPADMAVAYNLARVHNARGDAEAALAELRRAAAYQRKHVFYREQVGIQLRRMGRDAEALEVFRRNVADGVAGDVTRLNVRQLESRQAREAAAAPAP